MTDYERIKADKITEGDSICIDIDTPNDGNVRGYYKVIDVGKTKYMGEDFLEIHYSPEMVYPSIGQRVIIPIEREVFRKTSEVIEASPFSEDFVMMEQEAIKIAQDNAKMNTCISSAIDQLKEIQQSETNPKQSRALVKLMRTLRY